MAMADDLGQQARINLRVETSDTGTTNALGAGTQVNVEQLIYYVSQGSTDLVADQLLAAGRAEQVEEHPMVVASGIATVAQHIGRTLGPAGRRAAVRDAQGVRHEESTALGIVSVADTEDPRERIGALMMRELVQQVHQRAGDGSATAAVLAHHMVIEAIQVVAEGTHPAVVTRDLRAAGHRAAALLDTVVRPVQNANHIGALVRTATGRPEVGRLLGDAVGRVGWHGGLVAQETNTMEYELQYTSGITIDQGFHSPYFVTDHLSGTAVLDDAYVLVLDQYQPTIYDVLPLLEHVVPTGRPLLVVADALEEDFLNTLVVNKSREVFKSAAVRAPSQGRQQSELLADLALATGGHVVNRPELLQRADLTVLGQARLAVISETFTQLVGTGPDGKQLGKLVTQLQKKSQRAASEQERDWYGYRSAKLSTGAAVLRVGALSEADLAQRMAAANKGISVARGAARYGYVPGGGVALLHTRATLLDTLSAAERAQSGWRVLLAALGQPAASLAENAGHRAEPEALESFARQGQCFDVLSGRAVPFEEAGILDSAQSVRTALTSAVETTARFLDLL
ncbi:TCP-1/cpn60 chaperonin family protein [Streptomyces erythrochromogenes]|uniref:TCP-1/cpn60 chaperonin family protein n=1 Tax=Streptomyces erythrochromogenes TaxID=285574 RepID=UPI0034366D99